MRQRNGEVYQRLVPLPALRFGRKIRIFGVAAPDLKLCQADYECSPAGHNGGDMNWSDALPYLQFWSVTLLVFFALYGWVAALDYLVVNWLLNKKRGSNAGL
jgi:hypothetical protein